MKKPELFNQPKVFPLAFVTAMFERFGFYSLSFLLVLYAENTFQLSDHMAFILFGVYTGLAFLAPVIGGYLADNLIGIRRCIILGLGLEGLGLLVLSLPGHNLFYLGLALTIVGVGFFKTTPTHLLARSYEKGDSRIDSGFTLYYMAMNIGSLIAPISAGFLQYFVGWHTAFLSAGISLYIGLFAYFLMRKQAKELDSKPGQKPVQVSMMIKVAVGTILATVIFSILIAHTSLADLFFFIATGLCLCYFIYEIIRSPRVEKLKIIVCLALILMGMVFFILYFQFYTSIELYIERSVSHNIFGFHLPAVAFMSLNGIWILILSPFLASLYQKLTKHNKDLAVTTKFPLGLLITTLAFFCLYLSTLFPGANGKISSNWIVGSIALYSLGELLVSALGVAMITRIAPKRLYGIMMGTWYLIASALAASLSSFLADWASIPKTVHATNAILHIYGHAFLKIAAIGFIATIIAFAMSPYLKRIAELD